MIPGYVQLVEKVVLPPVALVRQNFAATCVAHAATAVREALAASPCMDRLRPGMRIALTVGSRGLTDLPELVATLVACLHERGTLPFIVPAMGSHGGATAEGQVALLEHLGITEKSAGCPIHSCMDTVEIGTLDNGMSVRMDRLALEADGIVLFNRIKPHSAFRAANESGLVKMLAIGLGKQSGAESCHAWGFEHMGHLIAKMARMKLARCNILFGVGTMENAHDRLARVVVLPPESMLDEEREYLRQAMRMMPRLPLGPLDAPLASGTLDVLVVDELGKEYTGSGIDPNITGRPSSTAITGGPDIARIVILDVSDKSNGNANGVGFADVITERLYRRYDREQVYPNALTSGILKVGALPMAMPNCRTAIQAAVKTCQSQHPEALRLIRIPNTLHLAYLYASEALLPELRNRPGVEILGDPQPMAFDADGNFATDWPRHAENKASPEAATPRGEES